jgi:DNA topoisomerase IB
MPLRQGQEALGSAPGGALSRSDPGGTGIRRRRCGRGFSYLGPDTAVIKDRRTLARIRALVIPPAWEDVWICVDHRGHIQAIGTDAAGRRQYRYHDLWREQRDQDKHDRVLEFGAALPRIREVICHHLEGCGLTRDRVLAAAIRLIDLGFFRPGGQEYAGENGTFGLATIRKEHVTLSHGQLMFEYLAKGDKLREQAVAEEQVCAVVRSLRRRRGGGDQLLAYRSGPRWHDVTARNRAIARVVREVAGYLGNTPAVARASSIDPRIIELYEDGFTIASVLGDLGKNRDFGDLATGGPAEAAVVKLLARHSQPGTT